MYFELLKIFKHLKTLQSVSYFMLNFQRKYGSKFLQILMILSCSAAMPQIPNIEIPEIQNFRKADYNGSPQNWDIVQNSIGYLYFANNNGLLEFDGTSWTILTIPNSKAIRSLAIDKNDTIYVGGFQEFGFFDKDKFGQYQYHSISQMVHSSQKEKDFIWKIGIVNGTVIFQSFDKLYLLKDKKIKIIKAPSKFQFSFVVNNIFYVQDTRLGILQLDHILLKKLPASEIFNNTEVWGIAAVDKTHFLFATLDKGLWIFDGNSFKVWQTEANDIVRRSSCLGLSVIAGEKFAFNTVLSGLVISDFKGKIIQKINRSNGLQNNTVLHSFVDNKSNLWLGLDNGISFINKQSAFSFFGIDYNLSTVYASQVHQGIMYVATNQGLYYKPIKNLSDNSQFQLVSGTTGQVWAVKSINEILFCGHNRGTMIIKNLKVHSILDSTGTWDFKTEVSNPNLIISSNYAGFSAFSTSAGNCKFLGKITGFSGSVNNFEFKNNAIWFLKNNVAHRLHLNKMYSSITKKELYQISKIKSDIFTNIFLFDGNLFTVSKNKFYEFISKQNSFVNSKKYSNIFAKVPDVNKCQQDVMGNLWYVANGSIGVMKKSSDSQYVNVYKQFNPLKDNFVANYEKVTSVDQNHFFVGINDGLVHFNLSSISKRNIKCNVFIKNVTFGNHAVINDKTDFIISKPLAYAENIIKFTFSAPNFASMSTTKFSYKLEGFDKKWSDWRKTAFKEYTNLREGNYKMMVRADNGYSTAFASSSCTFKILAPWYRSITAFLVYILLMGMGAYFLRILIKNKIRKNKYFETIEQRRLYSEKEFAIRQEQLELEKEIERLKNDKLQSELLIKNKELVNNSLQSVKKNKILNGILDGLKEIDISKLDDSVKIKFNKLNKNISKEVAADKSWKNLEHHIKNVHHDFLKRLKHNYPQISPREMDLATYLMLNMSTKEIAEALNISSAGVELARYRLRKKLNLVNKENLTGFLMSI